MYTIIHNGLIYDAVHEAPFVGDLLIDGGRIAAIGKNLDAPAQAQVVDASGLYVYPGLVEAHGHIGLDGWAVGYEGQDYNEYNDPVTPQLRAIDGINPFDEALQDAVRGGVTTLCTGPGSSNVLGGTFAAFKPVGTCIDAMCLLPQAAMKCAFGENPKRCYRDKRISSRMNTAALLRETLFKAREYMEKLDAAGDDPAKNPVFDIKLHAMLPVLRREIPLKAHAHQANDILTAIRIAREFGVKLTLEHVTDGALIADELARANIPLAVGPTFGRPHLRPAQQDRAQAQELADPRDTERRGLPGVHHHRQPRHPAEPPALLRRHGHRERHAALRRAAGHHHQSRPPHRRRRPRRIAGGGQGRRRRARQRQYLRASIPHTGHLHRRNQGLPGIARFHGVFCDCQLLSPVS